MSVIINKLELVYSTVESFDILMQNFYKLQQGKTEKVPLYLCCAIIGMIGLTFHHGTNYK